MIHTATTSGSKHSLLIAWSLAGCFLLTTILVAIFAARNILTKICCSRVDAPDAEKQIRLISPDSSVLAPGEHGDNDV
jgi:hypothetical protein